ncbi:glycosyltransferase family 2 protein [Gigaspora rosea]|uniref:Chitin synthase n=1 Tax=Gigaspora rosea TaxID=44941 RepID=A0A397UQP8_9GLOM|nr:glycosyltransferase family 2 protein [Gigaspora rosea]
MQNQNVYIQEGDRPSIQNAQEQHIYNATGGSVFLNIDSEKSTQHWGQAPEKQPRRYARQRIELKDGRNLVLECPIPADMRGIIPRNDLREFTHMRYTACTSGPDNFMEKGFKLRQVETTPPRATELFIVLTMYNVGKINHYFFNKQSKEDKDLLSRTFHGVVKNIAHLCSRERSRVWGKDGWQKVVVCIVADGREIIDKGSLAYLAALGVYQSGIEVGEVRGEPVNAHIFEYTTQTSIDNNMEIKAGEESEVVPIQVLFCLKEKNAKKINSHRWFFNAFGPILEPNICVLIDVGTEPGPKSIYNLWKAFNVDSNVAGACGEIVAMKGDCWSKLLNPIVAAQNFEYKMSNILDKPFESVFGYITVLPGAFSAYRYIALQNTKNDKGEEEGPLASYFKGEINDEKKVDKKEESIFTANMYLAEDRILCFELVAKRKSSWLLHYVKSSQAETDVPEDVTGLISQRRRWLNGSFFASFHAITHFYYIWRSDHSIFRKIFLHVEMAYQAYNLIFSWFALGNFYLTFYILGQALSNPQSAPWSPNVGNGIFTVLQYIYIALVITQFILAMGHRPQGSKWAYRISIIFFSLIMIYMLFAAFWLAVIGIKGSNVVVKEADTAALRSILSNYTFRNIILSLVSTYGLYFLASFMMLDPWHMFICIAQYILLVPLYIIILNIYAFCNIHDVSWGNRPDATKLQKAVNVESSNGKPTVEVAMPEDVNDVYNQALRAISQPKVEDVSIATPQQKKEDSRKSFRTMVVLLWIFSNALLIVAVTYASGDQSRTDLYMAIILWSVAGLAAFRFLGTTTYIIFRLFTDPNALIFWK